MKNLLVITENYPYKNDVSFNFVRNTVVGLADEGINCVVICPQSLTKEIVHKRGIRPRYWIDSTSKGASICVYQPYTASFSNIQIMGVPLTSFFMELAQKRVFKKIAKEYDFDLAYAHFWESGFQAAKLLETKSTPVVVICGEETVPQRSRRQKDSWLKKIKGVICVSSKNWVQSQERDLLKYSPKTEVIHNAFDPNRFYCVSQREARGKIGINSEKDVVGIFVGSFTERKGINRVLEAASRIPNLKLICIGFFLGKMQLFSEDQILFKGKVKNNELVYYLNSADFFVLPTLAEGCCNAILEALACGLPIISSNLPFNNEIIDDSCSIRIDPTNVEELYEAMKTLCDSTEKRNQLSQGALEKSKEFHQKTRIDKIIRFFTAASSVK